jgi:pyridoxal phosphate enzyme (YggS family)
MVKSLSDSYSEVRSRISNAAKRNEKPEPMLIAVSKGQSVDAIAELYKLGQRDFGENYVQELLEKNAELTQRGFHDLRWHFIGHLQTNKVKSLLPVIYTIHSVNSLKLAREISKRATRLVSLFIEVNIDQESSKSGIAPEQVEGLVGEVMNFPSVILAGLMCVPSAKASGDELRGSFSKMRDLSAHLGRQTWGSLSMGMSQDFELAIAEGATHIRVGSAIFGKRAGKA